MSEQADVGNVYGTPHMPPPPPPPPPPASALPATYSAPVMQPGFAAGPVGRIRPTGVAILLYVVTLGIYSLVWFYQVHEEMKRHKGTGLGGGIALIISILFGIAMPYITSAEVGELYERSGRSRPVSGATGLWSFPGALIVVGPIVWFVKTNGALNAYWRSLGAV